MKLFLAILAASLFALNMPKAHALAELDKQYSLESVGSLKAWDNLDGLFVDYIAAAYKSYFLKQSRFVLQDLSKAHEQIEKTNLKYADLIEDKTVLAAIARNARVQSLFRTKIYKEGSRYRFKIDWLFVPHMELIGSEEVVIDGTTAGSKLQANEVENTIHQALKNMIQKIPFLGHVTGRDEMSVTLNIGSSTGGLKKGDQVVLGTLDAVKIHPLLLTLADWKLTPVATVEIEEVEETLSFGKIIQENEGHQVTRWQKIIRIIPKAEEPQVQVKPEAAPEEKWNSIPRLGVISGGLWTGLLSRDYSTAKASGRVGSGLVFGARTRGELWLNNELFVDGSLGFAPTSYSQTTTGNQPSTSTNAQSSISNWSGALGYYYLTSPNRIGPRASVRLGYLSTNYNMRYEPSEFLGKASFGSLFLGLGADLPITGFFEDRIGGVVNLEFGVFTSANAKGLLDTNVIGSRQVNFSVGGYYRYYTRLSFQLMLDVTHQSLETKDSSTLTQKAIALIPSVLFSF